MEEQLIDLEIKLAYQDKKLAELDALVRTLVSRLDEAERDLIQLKHAVAPEEHVNEPPPHY
ncbi:MAG: SlyX family protein [Kofleriaceae bacterium]